MDEEFDYEALGLVPPPGAAPASTEADPYYDALSDQDKARFDAMTPDLQDMYRNNNLSLSPLTPEQEAEYADVAPVGGTSALSRDVTEEIKATQTPNDLTYQGVYGGMTDEETGQPIQRPPRAPLTRLGAVVSDVVLGEENDNFLQQRRDDLNAQFEEYMNAAREVYDTFPGVEENGIKVYQRVVRNEDGSVRMGEDGLPIMESIRLPEPDSNAFERIVENAAGQIQGQFGGFLTEGAITEQSEYELGIPLYEQSSGEEFLTDILAIGVPGTIAFKGTRSLQGTVRALRPVGVGVRSRVAAAAGYGASTGAMAFSDAIMSTEGDRGTFFTPEIVQSIWTTADDGTAADLAMFLDGMAFSGLFDAVAPVVGYGADFTKNRVSGIRAFFSRDFVRQRAYKEAMLSLITNLDPTIREVPAQEAQRRMVAMAEMFSDNAFLDVTLGNVTGRVQRDSATAALNGAKGYIAETRQSLRNTMSDAEWREYVDTEAASLALSMIEVNRALGANPEILQAGNRMAAQIADTIREAGRQGIPEGMTPEQAVETAMQSLVDLRNQGVQAAERGVQLSDNLGTAIRGDIANAATDNPFIADIMARYPEGTGFNDRELSAALADVMSGPLRQQFNQTWAAVDAAYNAIPNSAIDTQGLIDTVNTVVQAANDIDNTGDRARLLLRDIYSGLQPAQARNAGELVIEDPDELLERVGNIGFADLYRLKQTLSDMIDVEETPGVRKRLMQLSRHITSTGEGGQMRFLIDNGDAATAQAARAADAQFIEARSMFEGSEPMRRYSDLAREARRGDNTPVPEGAQPRGMADLRAQSVRDVVPTIVGDTTGEYMGNLLYALRNVPAEEITPIREYYEARAMFDLAAAMRNGDSERVNRIFDVANRNRSNLQAVGSNLIEDLYEVGGAIRRRENDLGNAVEAADQALTAAKEELQRAQDTILERFLRDGTDTMPVGNPNAVLTSMLFDGQAGDRFSDLMAQINRLPDGQREIALAALRERTSDILVDQLFGSTPVNIRGDQAQFNTMMGRLNTVLNNNTSDTIGALRQIYADDPVYFEGLTRALGGLMEANVGPRLRIAQAGSDTSINEDIRDSVSTGILLLFGYMNPTAAAARRLTSRQLAEVTNLADAVGKETLLVAASNPMEFARMIREVSEATTPSARQEAVRNFAAIASHGLGYDIRVGNPGETPLQDEIIGSVGIMEDEVNSLFGPQ